MKIQFVKNKRNIPLAANFLIKRSICLHCLSFCHRESILVFCCNGFKVNPFLGELLNLSVQCLMQQLAKANLVFREKFAGRSTSTFYAQSTDCEGPHSEATVQLHFLPLLFWRCRFCKENFPNYDVLSVSSRESWKDLEATTEFALACTCTDYVTFMSNCQSKVDFISERKRWPTVEY